MKVFKFGGASIKDAKAIKNAAGILKKHVGEQIVILFSAMEKNTNALEKLTYSYFNNISEIDSITNNVKSFHNQVLKELFPDKKHTIYNDIEQLFLELDWTKDREFAKDFNYLYDQIVSIGEILSSTIVSAYLNSVGIKNQWLDVREVLKTDDNYRAANVLWRETSQLITQRVPSLLDEGLVVTQGFIGSTTENISTTLGREGSDYSAAVFANILNAEKMIVWKDVPGILNADPKIFSFAEKIDHLSYYEIIKMTYYGAKVLHVKTVKPLLDKGIPLEVRSFLDPEKQGTIIGKHEVKASLPPIIITKEDQALLFIMTNDFSFISEADLSVIYSLFSKFKISINMLKIAATNISVCINDNPFQMDALIKELIKDFKIVKTDNLQLITIRHGDDKLLNKLIKGKRTLLELKGRNTQQVVVEK